MNINYNNPKAVIRGFWGCSLKQNYRDFNFGEAFMLFEEKVFCKLEKLKVGGDSEDINRLDILYNELLNERLKGLLHKKKVFLFDKVIHEQHLHKIILGRLNIAKIREEFENGL